MGTRPQGFPGKKIAQVHARPVASKIPDPMNPTELKRLPLLTD